MNGSQKYYNDNGDNMIKGIGCDLVNLERIKKSDIMKLAKRILTEREFIMFSDSSNEKRKIEFLAGRFAAKEAYSKALGFGIGQVGFKDIEILNDEAGKPVINSDNSVHISITHTDEYAMAFAVVEK